jgi:hypothetical protein
MEFKRKLSIIYRIFTEKSKEYQGTSRNIKGTTKDNE